MQLLDSESRSSTRRLATIGGRIRDGLLRDNRVVPAVLAVLALLVFAWIIAGTFMGGPGEEEQQQASNQASLAQEDSKNGDSGSPAPKAENRDTDSYAVFESKDPFRQLAPKAGQGANNGDQESGDGGRDRASDRGGDRSGSNRGGESSRDRSSPGGSDSRGGARQGGTGQSGIAQSVTGQDGAGQAGGADLFNSGGDLPAP